MPISLTIASPCPAEWSQMDGDDHTRFCHACEKSVYNVETLSETEVRALVQDDTPCLRLFKRFDGTLITKDCAVGVRIKLAKAHRNFYRVVAAAAVMAITAAAAVANIGRQRVDGSLAAERVVGKIFRVLQPPMFYLGGPGV